jgi:hypothetical protein
MKPTRRPPSKIRRPLATTLVLAAAALLLVASLAGPVAAKKPDGAKVRARPFNVVAIVVATDGTAGTLTATVVKGNHAMKDRKGTEVTFTVLKDALILKVGDATPVAIPLSSISKGDRVHIVGRIHLSTASAPVFNARLILDRGPRPPTT